MPQWLKRLVFVALVPIAVLWMLASMILTVIVSPLLLILWIAGKSPGKWSQNISFYLVDILYDMQLEW